MVTVFRFLRNPFHSNVKEGAKVMVGEVGPEVEAVGRVAEDLARETRRGSP